ncbi:armadillo-type protein [Lipomyces orientalis]|uniref:Armadillo-type protein n=1 Tax=Lipomyces orientalis TaxID=1233043 RepID=A0ACC3TPU5_9ASCO
MPREQKKRGRRLNQKPYEKSRPEPEPEPEPELAVEDEACQDGVDHEAGQQAFYGLLDSTQIEYFKEMERIIDSNTFTAEEEREQFYEALWAEVNEIELKVSTDPTGSKIFERLLLASPKEKLLDVYKAYSTRILELSTQRFSSHCLETLLNCSRAFISSEIQQTPDLIQVPTIDTENAPVISTVSDFFAEIENDIPAIAFHPYGSHVFRSFLLLCSGKEFVKTGGSSVLSGNKSLSAKKAAVVPETFRSGRFEPPAVFKQFIENVLQTMVNGITLEKGRKMALDPISSPVLQLLIELEDDLMRADILSIILPPTKGEPDFMTVSFLESLLSNPVGSHFLEKLLYSCPLSYVEYLYNSFFADRLRIISKAKGFSFAVKALMQRLDKKSYEEFGARLLDEVTDLSLQNVLLLNNIIVAISQHGSLQTDVAKKITGLCSDRENMLLALLDISSFENISARQRSSANDSLKQRSILVENLLKSIPQLSEPIVESFIAFPADTKLQFTENTIFSHVVETILSKGDLPLPTRRKLLNDFMGHFGGMACSVGASRVVDACNITSAGLNHYRERIAQELLADRESVMRSLYGKKVWKNWNMDLYARSSAQWKGKLLRV